MKIIYADPPYIGQAKRHYDSNEINHKKLLKHLVQFNGWALSCSSPSLQILIPMLNKITLDYRIGAWVKPFCIFKPNVNPAYAWEPILFKSARKGDRNKPTTRDWVSANITLKKGLVGVKPDAFSFWLFELLGAEPEDEFIDMFPGSGAVSKAWNTWCQTFREIAQKSPTF